jgi:protein gp37
MADHSKIEWTETTWNPLTGCTRVSAGCDHCYIERTPPFRMAGRRFVRGDGLTSNAVGSTTGVEFHPARLTQPFKWRAPRRVFVNSLADLFHDDVPVAFIADVFAVMALTGHHTYQLLTKRHDRMRSVLTSQKFTDELEVRIMDRAVNDMQASLWGFRYPLPNVWLGVSVENQTWADRRIPALLATPAAVRWISAEPLLGPVDLTEWHECDGCALDWVVAGGESGPGARPMDPAWMWSIRDQCRTTGTALFFKQWGDWVTEGQSPQDITLPGTSHRLLDEDGPSFYWVGKGRAGRELDGRTHDDYPGGPNA